MSQINIGNLDIDKFYLGNSDSVTIYLGDTLLYPHSQPQPAVSYGVTEDISTYQDTTYLDVYNMADDSWYKRNNLNEYELYGVYGESTASTETYYNGKLSVVDGYEYKYANGQWNNIGEATIAITPITTGFSASQVLETVRFDISGTTSSVQIYLSTEPNTEESWSNWYIRMQGTSSQIYYTTDGNNRTQVGVTACTLVSGTTYEFTFPYPMYFNAAYSYSSRDISGMPLVMSAYTQALVEEYVDKPQPNFYNLYDTVADMEAETDLYYGKYGQVGNVVYKYVSTDEWTTTADKIMTGTTVSNIRSSHILVNGATPQYRNDKYYVNGTPTNGVYNFFYHNEIAESGIAFIQSNDTNSDLGIVSFDWNTLDTTNITSTYYLISGGFSFLKEITIPPYLTAIISSSFVNVYNNSCPIRINIRNTSDITLGNNINSFLNVSNADIYIYNGIKINGWIPSSSYGNGLKIHCPSSAVSSYREDATMKYAIPFIIPMDDGEADLSYGYYYYSYNNYWINLTATSVDSETISVSNYPYYIKLGSKLSTIYSSAFTASTASTTKRVFSLTFEEGVEYINDYAFYKANNGNASNLPNQEWTETCGIKYSVRLPDSVKRIGQYAFARMYTSYISGEELIVIGSGTTSIGYRAFYFAGKFLNYPTSKIVCKAVVPPTLGGQAFYQGTTTYIEGIYVPDESVDAYKAASGWSDYASVIKSLNDYVK